MLYLIGSPPLSGMIGRGWLRTAQAQSWVSEEGGGVRHIVVTLNKRLPTG